MALTLQAVRLLSVSKTQVVNQQLYTQIIRCFMDSLDQEWIPTPCKSLCYIIGFVLIVRFLISLGWVLVCEIFVKIPEQYLTEVFMLAQVVDKMGLCGLSRSDRPPHYFREDL